MINIIANTLITAEQGACVCICYSPGCQSSDAYLEGYANGQADAVAELDPQY